MPDTTAVFVRSVPVDCMAIRDEEKAVPIPHPGHHMCGMRSVRRIESSGCLVGEFLFIRVLNLDLRLPFRQVESSAVSALNPVY
jgi:hypothetical protein